MHVRTHARMLVLMLVFEILGVVVEVTMLIFKLVVSFLQKQLDSKQQSRLRRRRISGLDW